MYLNDYDYKMFIDYNVALCKFMQWASDAYTQKEMRPKPPPPLP